MALNIKNQRVESLATEIADMTGESKTQAIRKALEERKERLAFRLDAGARNSRLLDFLEREVWPVVPDDVLGRPVTREEEAVILGLGSEGVPG